MPSFRSSSKPARPTTSALSGSARRSATWKAWTARAAARYESGLTAYATEKLSTVEGLRIYGSQPDKCSILSFTIDGTHPYDVGMILDKLGIAVRTGTHCAEPVMAHYGITSMVRASLAMYNTSGEIDMLAEGLKRAARMLRS